MPRTELTVHQVVEIILLRCAFKQEGIARFEERARAGPPIGQILLLKLRKALRFQDRNLTFVLHIIFLSYRYSQSSR